MKPNTGRWIGIGILAIGFILTMIGLDSRVLPVLVLGVIILFGGGIFSLIYWVCPSCASVLPSRGRTAWFVEYCHRCGESIDKPRFRKK